MATGDRCRHRSNRTIPVILTRSGLGSDLLIDAGKRALAAADVIGARAIVVQAFNEDAKTFYEQFGFLPFSDREPLMLLLRISELRAVLQA